MCSVPTTSPKRAVGASLLPHSTAAAGSQGLQGLGHGSWLCTQEPAQKTWDITLWRAFEPGCPSREVRSSLGLRLPQSPYLAGHTCVGSASLGAGDRPPPPSLFELPKPPNLLGGQARGILRGNQCWGPPLSQTRLVGCNSLPVIAAVRHRVAARVRREAATGLHLCFGQIHWPHGFSSLWGLTILAMAKA